MKTLTAQQQFENEVTAVIGRWVDESDLTAADMAGVLVQSALDVCQADSDARKLLKPRASRRKPRA
jgi:hypothetical protein